MKCQNHPSAPAIENCARCEIPLCGMCANFSGDEVLCEACVEVREAEKAVASKSRDFERPKPVAMTTDNGEDEHRQKRKKGYNSAAIQLVVIGVCAVVLATRFIFFTSESDTADAGSESLAQVQMLSSLAQCLVQFQQIGEDLVAGDLPEPTTTCPGSALPLIVTETADDVIVEHPEPAVFGYTEILVSRSNPVPQMTQ
ncbi:MAG: hypothetical protein RL839_04940 [Gammaproteobacteria bacterium]